MTKAPGTLVPTWEQNVHVAQAADRAGWEFLLPLGRWKGSGGEINLHDRNFEVYTWAAAIAAITKQIQVFTTSHLRLVHPVMAAKQGATIDVISNGRSAVNIVAGQKADEVAMFGIEQVPHDELYEIAEEWTVLLKRLYTEEAPFDHAGRHYRMKGARINPKPVQKPYPPIVNAGLSPAGRAFGAKHADFTFVNDPDVERLRGFAADIRAEAFRAYGREIGMLNHGYVVCRDTEKEALDYVHYYVDELGDWSAAAAYADVFARGGGQSLTKETVLAAQRSFVAGFHGFPFVGTAEQIVDKMLALADAGINGCALHWVDFEAGVELFNERVLPLMVQAGLRKG